MKYDFDMTLDEHSSIGKIVAQITDKSNVLEFGPGNGRMTNYLTSEKKCNVSIVELDSELYNFVMQFAKDGFLGNIEEYKWLDYFSNKKFDYIIFADVLEHLTNPEKTLEKVKNLLAPNGKLLITFPNLAHNSVLIDLFNNQLNWKKEGLLDSTHNTFFTQNGFYNLFNRLNLNIAIEDYTYSQVGQNEINSHYEDLPESIRYAFKNRPFGEVYQYFYALQHEPVEMPTMRNPENSNFVKRVQLAFTINNQLQIHPMLFNNFTGDNKSSVHQISQDVQQLKIVPVEGSAILQFDLLIDNIKSTDFTTNAVWSNADTFIFTGMDENPYFILDGKTIAGKEITLTLNIISENQFSEIEKLVLEHSKQQTKEIQNLAKKATEIKLDHQKELSEEKIKVQELLNQEKVKKAFQNIEQSKKSEFKPYSDDVQKEITLTVETIENDEQRHVAIIKGWGYNNSDKSPLLYKIPNYISLFYKTTPLFRKDVNDAHELPEKGKYGFIIEIENYQIDKFVYLNVDSSQSHFKLFFNRENLNNTPILKRLRFIGGSIKQQGIMGYLRNRRNRQLMQDAYEDWIGKNEQFDKTAIKREISQFSYQPKISIVVPVYNVEEKWLRACVDSLLNQYYQNWELCLADDHSPSELIKPMLEEYLQKDERIKVIFREENGHISKATNSAISIATGEYIGFMDNDDELAPIALYEVVKAINEDRDYEFIYSDEDKMATNGKRFDPFFKPNWNEELLLGHNYITHFVVTTKKIVDQLGGLRSEYDGSQDYDFVLRATEAAKKIHHIPHILYHWRTVETSVAFDPTSKEYAYVAGKEAVKAALKRRNIKAEVSMTDNYGAYKVDYKYVEEPRVSIVPIGNFTRVSEYVENILNNTYYSNFEIVLPKRFKQTFPTSNEHVLFVSGETVNEMAKLSQGEYLVFLDELLTPKNSEWLNEFMSYIRKSSIGLVTGKIVTQEDMVVNVGVTVDNHNEKIIFEDFGTPKGSIGNYFRSVLPREIYSATANNLIISKRDFLEIGGFDLSLDDIFRGIVLSQKIYHDLNKKIVFEPYSQLETMDSELPQISTADYQASIKDYLDFIADPYTNPNSLI
jgi:glycosyltransferase involved in cell wall biosynthesis/SAM-dependent methyltransferase